MRRDVDTDTGYKENCRSEAGSLEARVRVHVGCCVMHDFWRGRVGWLVWGGGRGVLLMGLGFLVGKGRGKGKREE